MSDAQNPNPPPTSDPFGPDDAPKPKGEHYDTRYLVANLKRDNLRVKLVVLGVVLLCIVALAIVFGRQSASQPSPSTALPTATAKP